MLRFNPITPVMLWVQNDKYVSGKGAVSTWQPVCSGAVNTYFCEWRGTYGERLLQAQAMGVGQLIKIRMSYNPDVYTALATKRCIIVKNADVLAFKNGAPDETNINLYELYSGVDNVAQENQFLEFNARRYQNK